MKPLAPDHKPLFVYGTLLPGQPNFGLLEKEITHMEPAVLDNSQIFDMGYYPMLVVGEPGNVVGSLVEIQRTGYEKVLDQIDNLENYDPMQVEQPAFKRMLRGVSLQSGKKISAWVYEGNQNLVSGAPVIDGGDWLQYVRSRKTWTATWWQTIEIIQALTN